MMTQAERSGISVVIPVCKALAGEEGGCGCGLRAAGQEQGLSIAVYLSSPVT